MAVKDTIFSKKQKLNISGQLVDLTEPKVMGIVNITPDSFYTESRSTVIDEVIKKVEKHINEGADFIDIGAFSTRPGAEYVSYETEKERLAPALHEIRKCFPNIWLSIDTFRASIAEWAVNEFGVGIINDISGGQLDETMFETIARLKVPYILMHMRGTPETMQLLSDYSNVTKDVLKELSEKIFKLHNLGVNDIIVDPGFGFSKTLEQNYTLLRELEMFKILEKPMIVGISRKSMINNVLNSIPNDALNGTTVLHTLALINGASILRVHDVKEALETIKIVKAYNSF